MHQHRRQDQHPHHPRRTTRLARRRRLLGAALVPALGLGVLAGPAPVSLADTVTPGAPPMPAALSPGKVTAPLFPLRSVPACGTPCRPQIVRHCAVHLDLSARRRRVASPIGALVGHPSG